MNTERNKQLWVMYRDNDDGQLMVAPAAKSKLAKWTTGRATDNAPLHLLELNFYGRVLRFSGNWERLKESYQRIELRRLARLVGEERRLREAQSCYVYDPQD